MFDVGLDRRQVIFIRRLIVTHRQFPHAAPLAPSGVLRGIREMAAFRAAVFRQAVKVVSTVAAEHREDGWGGCHAANHDNRKRIFCRDARTWAGTIGCVPHPAGDS